MQFEIRRTAVSYGQGPHPKPIHGELDCKIIFRNIDTEPEQFIWLKELNTTEELIEFIAEQGLPAMIELDNREPYPLLEFVDTERVLRGERWL